MATPDLKSSWVFIKYQVKIPPRSLHTFSLKHLKSPIGLKKSKKKKKKSQEPQERNKILRMEKDMGTSHLGVTYKRRKNDVRKKVVCMQVCVCVCVHA